jgi:hypothetical protein
MLITFTNMSKCKRHSFNEHKKERKRKFVDTHNNDIYMVRTGHNIDDYKNCYQ